MEIVSPMHLLTAARGGDAQAFGVLTEPFRRELVVHCYRLLGSIQDAEDLVQETLLRAWQRLASFEGRSTLRAWLYKIATNGGLDMLDQRRRRAMAISLYPPTDPSQPIAPSLNEPIWLEPIPDAWLATTEPGPEAVYTAHESISLAFLAALQLLPPRQRAVLLMRDVLGWRAAEVAELLDLTVASVNSALNRARSTLAEARASTGLSEHRPPASAATRALLDRYVTAWETADIPGLVSLLREEIRLDMPPSPTWYDGKAAVAAIMSTVILAETSPLFGGEARRRWRLRETQANGQPAYWLYCRQPDAERYQATGLMIVTCTGDAISAINFFLDPALLRHWQLPSVIEASAPAQ